MKNKYGFLLTILVFGFYTTNSFSTNTQRAKQNVMLILDASGSMWGQIAGKAKIDIARSAISQILTRWNSDTHIGVMTYGHRAKGDCSDIQTLRPVGRVDRSQIMHLLNGLSPKGKTPLGASIIMAANSLKSREEAASVVLVSDGLDTCGMDPCEVARKLKRQNINLRIHVIGFDVNNVKDISKLQCIATNTGGKYIRANNINQLNHALNIVNSIVRKKIEFKPVIVKSGKTRRLRATIVKGEARVVAPTVIKSGSTRNQNVVIVKRSGAKQVGLKLQAIPAANAPPITRGMHYTIYKLNPDGTKSNNEVASKYNVGGVVITNLAPGRYYAEAYPEKWYSNNTQKMGAVVEIKKGKLSHYIFTLNVGMLKLKIDPNTSKIPTSFQYDIETDNPAENKSEDVAYVMGKYLDKKTGKTTFLLKPGRYKVSVKSRRSYTGYSRWAVIKKISVTISINRTSSYTFDLGNK